MTTEAQTAIPAINELNENKASKEDLAGYLPSSGGTGDGFYRFRKLLPNKYAAADHITFEPYIEDGTVLRPLRITLGDGYAYFGDVTSLVLSYRKSSSYLHPLEDKVWRLGGNGNSWANVYTAKLNNGADLIVPTEGGTLARIEDIDERIGDISTALSAILGE